MVRGILKIVATFIKVFGNSNGWFNALVICNCWLRILQSKLLPFCFAYGFPTISSFSWIIHTQFWDTYIKMNKLIGWKIHFWARYVDEIFCIWSGTDRTLDQFLNYKNKSNKQIQSNIQEETENILNFLGFTITKHSEKLNLGVYRKPTMRHYKSCTI